MKSLAFFLSVAGHPLITSAAFAGFTAFSGFPFTEAILITICVFSAVVIPVAFRNYNKLQRGDISNFDVSDVSQRNGFYIYFLLLLIFVFMTFTFFDLGGSEFQIGTGGLIVLVLFCYLINTRIKISLHSSINMYYAVLLILLNYFAAIIFAVFTVFVAISRIKLNAHSKKEVITGLLAGALIGTLTMLLISLLP